MPLKRWETGKRLEIHRAVIMPILLSLFDTRLAGQTEDLLQDARICSRNLRGMMSCHAGNFVEGDDAAISPFGTKLDSKAEFMQKLKETLQPGDGLPRDRVLLGQVLKSALLVGQPLIYRAPNNKSSDLTGTVQ